MTDDEHRQLAGVLRSVKGKVALSGYDCTLMQELYGDWNCIKAPQKQCHSIKELRQEVLWVNYDLTTSILTIEENAPCPQPQQLSLM